MICIQNPTQLIKTRQNNYSYSENKINKCQVNKRTLEQLKVKLVEFLYRQGESCYPDLKLNLLMTLEN